eukprot:COSAG05_NODE_3705_length_1893_cov_159.411145_1_plen_93_part_10
MQLSATCGPNHTGFLCAFCDEGFAKISGKCSECTGVSPKVLAFGFFGCVMLALWFLKQAIVLFCPEAEASEVFHSVDVDGSGYLDQDEVLELI